MFANHYVVDYNGKNGTYDVVIEMIRKEYVFRGLTDVNLAEQIADKLNEALFDLN